MAMNYFRNGRNQTHHRAHLVEVLSAVRPTRRLDGAAGIYIVEKEAVAG